MYTTSDYINTLMTVENDLNNHCNIKEYKIYRDHARQLVIDVIIKNENIRDHNLENALKNLADMAVNVQNFERSIINIMTPQYKNIYHDMYSPRPTKKHTTRE